MKDNNKAFINAYKTLEKVVRKAYNLDINDSISFTLKNDQRFIKYKDEITYCQNIRNFLQHETDILGAPAIIPSDQMIRFIKMLIDRIQNPKKCFEISKKYPDVYKRNLSDYVLESIKVMHESDFMSIPIMKNRKVIGIFDETTIIKYLASHNCIEETTTFNDIYDYIKLRDNQKTKVLFRGHDTEVEDLKNEFIEEYKKGNRIRFVILTAHGNSNEDLEGIITHWDILGND